ncbi:MAG: NAD(P)-binding domain-containing protein, partial [Proteobacteria bacterium]|nr:NAD(P)-binding domain-containing protein [Pseudomonadota bacterium]
MNTTYPVIVIGAGQAGLATSFHLKNQGIKHIVLEASQIANSWHQRWDSFKLVTPNWMNNLPGAKYQGDKPDEFLTKSEVLSYFNRYVLTHELPIKQGIAVTSMTKDEKTGIFTLATHLGNFQASAVVVCCGLFQKAYIPEVTTDISPQLKQ